MTDAARDWDVPYIPPEGIQIECLSPDACKSCDDPAMSKGLLPLDRVDWPQLRHAPGSRAGSKDDEGWNLGLFIAKECAGMSHECRPETRALREAFRTGQFTQRHRIALGWAFSGMPPKYAFPGLIAGARLPIFEVARCFWTAFDGAAFGCGPWLNQWAEDPDRPHPHTVATERIRRDHPWLLDGDVKANGAGTKPSEPRKPGA